MNSMASLDASTTAPASAAAGGTWRFDAEEAAEVLRTPAIVELRELGVIAVAGDEAAPFLQSQLTNEVVKLGNAQLSLNGYCTPKGRLLATFRVWRDAQAVYLQLPRELLPGVLKRLSMFVLRAKAKLSDASAAWSAFAIFGRGAAAWCERAFGALPERPGDCVAIGTARLARLQPSARVPERFMLLLPAAQTEAPGDRLAELPRMGSGVFWWSEIDAAVPTVFAATQEKFVPQMINFEVVGGVSFSKGCYPGQEVVARSQYRGKLKRRMQRGHSSAEASAGADVFAAGEEEPIGNVVMASSDPEGGFALLFECTLEKAEAALRLQGPDGPAIELRPLPYDIVDVTA
jgi:folate-binding protein YgfZ